MKCKEWNDVGVWGSPVEEGIICITGGGATNVGYGLGITDTGYGEGISTDETWV